MLAPRVLKPLTDKLVTPVTAPLKTDAPVIVKPCAPPSIPLVVIVLPDNVRSAPLKVRVLL